MASLQPPQTGPVRNVVRFFLSCTLAIMIVFPANGMATEILLGTGAVDTFSHFAGRAVCRVINRNTTGLDCQTIPVVDGIHNLTNLQGGSLDMALVENSMIYDAINKKEHFEYLDIRYDNLGDLTPLYHQAIVLVARMDAGIDSLDHLKGKSINAGIPRSQTRQAVELIISAKGWTYDDFKMVEALPASLSQDTMAFCHGSVQALVHIGVHPDSGMEKLITLCNAVPVNMDDPDIVKLVDGHPGYSRIDISAGTYPGIDQSVSTFGTAVSLVASGSLDDETVQTIMAALDAHRQVLQNAHPAMEPFSLGRPDTQDIGLPLHPGAAAYLARQ